MRIVYLHQYFNGPSSSSSTRSYEFARRLVALGHEVHVVSSERTGPVYRGWRTANLAGFTLHTVSIPYSNKMSYRQRLGAFLKFAAVAGRRARRLRPNVVFATSTPLTISIPAWRATVRTRTPIVFEVRDLWPEVPIAMGALPGRLARRLAFGLQRFAYSNAKHIVALSPDMKAGIVKRGFDSGDVTVIPNSADIDVFGDNSQPGAYPWTEWAGAGPLLVYCGTLGRVNNVDYIVQLARVAKIERPDYRFLILGDGAERKHIESLASELGVLGFNLLLSKPIPKTELPGVYAAASLSFSTVAPIPELSANSANKFFDSLAAATPIAINYGGWQADVLRRSGAGIVLDPTDPGGAFSDLAAFIDDEVRLESASAAARELAVGEYARDKHAEELHRVLTTVVGLSPTRPD